MNDIAEGEGDLTRRLDVDGRDEVAETAPKISTIYIPLDKVGEVIAGLVQPNELLSEASDVVQRIEKRGHFHP